MIGAESDRSAPAKTGRFITLEGGEGAGKSTQARLLRAFLEERGRTVIATREPGGSPAAEAVRRLLVEGEPGRWDGVAEALLHSAARRAHVMATIRPALAAGQWVICDRFADSTLAYQGYGHGLGRAVIEQLAQITLDDLRPDLTLIFDLPVEIGLARAGHRPGAETRYERMGSNFHERVREGFLDIARQEPQRCALIEASVPPDAVFSRVIDAVTERLCRP